MILCDLRERERGRWQVSMSRETGTMWMTNDEKMKTSKFRSPFSLSFLRISINVGFSLYLFYSMVTRTY